jgi:glycosyltransferase involved in cell wall biosynthesis
MLAGKPVLSSNCKYLKKIVEKTKAGLIYSDKNIKDFRNKLSQLIADKKLRTKLGENGHNAAIEKYNWGNTSKSLIELYKNIA